jgi:hypothetical protein
MRGHNLFFERVEFVHCSGSSSSRKLGGNKYPLGSRVACYIGARKVSTVTNTYVYVYIWVEYYSIPYSTYYIV